jgi:DNA modification methylase
MHWPADCIERRPISSLVPYTRNARTHSDSQIDQIANSMQEWGWTNPVLIAEDGTIVAGHGRVRAAQRLGWSDAPVMIARGWSEAQVRSYAIADNKLAMNADWDMASLSAELQELDCADADLGLLGFSDSELASIQEWTPPNAGLTDPDDAPAISDTAVTIVGDLWQLGSHRLICGDATAKAVVNALLADVVPHLMVTDPPYGIAYRPEWRNEAFGEGNRSIGAVLNDDRADWREAWALFPGDVAYVWHAGTRAATVSDSLAAAGFEVRSQLIWAKQHFAISRGHYHVQHEPCWYAVRSGATGHWNGDRKQSTLWSINNGLSQGGARKEEDLLTGHGTQKPVECMRRPIENNSIPGQAIYDPFVGSGTTVIAAEQTGRVCYAIELNPLYVDMAIRRWQAFTGQHATAVHGGRTFEEMSHERS